MEDEFTVRGQESPKIPVGAHNGMIKDLKVETRKDFTYLDIHVALRDVKDGQGNPVTIKTGVPHGKPTPKSLEGKMLMRFGVTEQDLISGKPIDIKELMLGRLVECIVMDEVTPNGTYAHMVKDSLKPRSSDTRG